MRTYVEKCCQRLLSSEAFVCNTYVRTRVRTWTCSGWGRACRHSLDAERLNMSCRELRKESPSPELAAVVSGLRGAMLPKGSRGPAIRFSVFASGVLSGPYSAKAGTRVQERLSWKFFVGGTTPV